MGSVMWEQGNGVYLFMYSQIPLLNLKNPIPNIRCTLSPHFLFVPYTFHGLTPYYSLLNIFRKCTFAGNCNSK